jgi:hypothetical protein
MSVPKNLDAIETATWCRVSERSGSAFPRRTRGCGGHKFSIKAVADAAVHGLRKSNIVHICT